MWSARTEFRVFRHPPLMSRQAKVFEDRYMPEPNRGCWLWLQAVDKDGYGKLGMGGKTLKAHKFSYELHNGPITRGLHVLHSCDMPSCVNPDHLSLGTHTDNMRDQIRKGRKVVLRGENAGMTKLTKEQVLEIRAATDYNYVVAAKYNIGATQVFRIKHGQSWKHLMGL